MATQPGLDVLPPSPDQAMTAYRLVDGWVRAWSVPGQPAREDLDALARRGLVGEGDFEGAAVTLRLAGEVVGRGVDMTAGPECLWLATRAALAEADRRLPKGNDLLAEEAHRQTVSRITISLELAGPSLAITPAPKSYADASMMLAPGLDGVVVRFGGGGGGGGRREAAVFPGQMLATNTLPGGALAAAASQASGDAALSLVEPAQLAERHGAAFLRFRTTHLAQVRPGAMPAFLDRGGRIVQVSEMNAAELRRTADAIYDHLRQRARDGDAPHQIYEPWRDATDAAKVSLAERALVAFASHRYSRLAHVPGARAAQAESFAMETAQRLHELAARDIAAGYPGARVQAALVAALTAPLREADAGEAGKPLRELFNPESGFSAELPAAARGLAAFGLVSAAALPDAPPAAFDHARAAVRAAFRDIPEGQLVGQMPWLGWAEVRLADLARRRDPGAAQVPSAVALRRMREQVWQHQISAMDAGPDDRDMIGGVIFTRARTPLPTWQAARPLAFLATMLGDERLTDPGEFNAELVHLLTSLRFLRQLQADETSLWLYPSRERAVGGVRASLWDQRMPLEASAITLLAVCEALDSLERHAQRQENAGR